MLTGVFHFRLNQRIVMLARKVTDVIHIPAMSTSATMRSRPCIDSRNNSIVAGGEPTSNSLNSIRIQKTMTAALRSGQNKKFAMSSIDLPNSSVRPGFFVANLKAPVKTVNTAYIQPSIVMFMSGSSVGELECENLNHTTGEPDTPTPRAEPKPPAPGAVTDGFDQLRILVRPHGHRAGERIYLAWVTFQLVSLMLPERN